MWKAVVWLILLPAWLCGTELKPWYDREFEIQTRGSALFQFYPYVHTPCKNFHWHGRDGFYSLSASLAAFEYSAELEFVVADTEKQHLDVDAVRLTGRYRFLDDIVGDPITLTGNVIVTQAFNHSIFDISSFHHGHVELEAGFSFGREHPCMEFWANRWWGFAMCGIADTTGAPWLHLFAAWEKNWTDLYQLRFFAESLFGFGGHHIKCPNHFRGYGKIKHRSLDVGARFSYLFDYGQELSLQYAFRTIGYNFPTNASLITVTFLYPIGL